MPGAKHFSDLDCWKLSNELKCAIYTILRRPHVVGDFRFVDDVRDAAASAPRNIAEGFGRRSHREFAHFLDIARGSLHECQNYLNDAVDRGYIEPAECEALLTLSRRAAGATAALQRYLRRR